MMKYIVSVQTNYITIKGRIVHCKACNRETKCGRIFQLCMYIDVLTEIQNRNVEYYFFCNHLQNETRFSFSRKNNFLNC